MHGGRSRPTRRQRCTIRGSWWRRCSSPNSAGLISCLMSSDGRAGMETVGPGAWLVPGSLRLGDLRDFLDETDRTGRGRRITESQRPQGAATRAVTTIAGLILHILGRLPRAGDRVRIRNLTLQVQSMNGRRIERVLLRLEGAPPAGASAGPAST